MGLSGLGGKEGVTWVITRGFSAGYFTQSQILGLAQTNEHFCHKDPTKVRVRLESEQDLWSLPG